MYKCSQLCYELYTAWGMDSIVIVAFTTTLNEWDQTSGVDTEYGNTC